MAFKAAKTNSKSEWISPHKLSLLVLIKALCRKEKDDLYSDCITRCRQKLSLFMLEILQVPDIELRELCERLQSIDSEQGLESALLKWLQEINAEGVSSLIDFFQSLEEFFSGKEPALQKTSLFGLFVRRMSLLFHKMTFSQVSHFHTLLQEYVDSMEHQSKDTYINESMESIKSLTIDTSIKEKQASSKIKASKRQAQFFLEKQASLIQGNEGAALSPVELQNKISQLLEISPDITEAHFVSYLNCLRVDEFKQAMDSLYHYFDQQQWNTQPLKIATDGNGNEDEKCKRFRYAALNLAALHCHFGHTSEALAALKEAIQIAQETNDHVCLEHCLGWLYRLEQEGSSQATVLLDRYVSKAAELKLPYLTSLSMLTHARHDAIIGVPPPKVFLAMSHINVINSQNSLQDLTATTHVQHAAIWQCYGKCHIASVYSQLQLNQNSTRQTIFTSNDGESKQSDSLVNGEASCLSLCNLAKLHADQCMYKEAYEILEFCKDSFPQPTEHSKKWMLTEALIEHDRALFKADVVQAKKAVNKIVPLDESEATYRSALNMIYEGNTAEAYPVLQKLLQDCKQKTTSHNRTKSLAEFHTNVLLALCKLYTVSGNSLAAMPHLLDCLTLACSHYLDHIAALASICIGHLQLQLGLPAKALVLVKTSMVHLLAHGSLYIQSCAQFLLVKCQLATSLSSNSNTKRKQALLSALPTLDTILGNFRKLEAMHKVRDVLYHKARIYEELGYAEERNRCANECCQILKEQSQNSCALALCCL